MSWLHKRRLITAIALVGGATAFVWDRTVLFWAFAAILVIAWVVTDE